ncbi:MAG TPA: DUF2255 family protein [Bacteroidota bacterium]|nr:DUF2255 family protein [Bacteroidota bacterium]
MPTRFSKPILATLEQSKILGIRVGSNHRFIGIWVVVVERRVFVRSWALKPDGWYNTLLKEPQATIDVNGRRLRVRSIRTKSERLKSAVDGAYKRKYNTPGSFAYVRGFSRPKRRNTTLELVPLL